ncbi:AGE family epimerase/isomerase [Angustibacter luteus]|uniref:AGE family epimerase/isomerase n=1 Tax=Angustibacter luteus TaxID=658456 RepID=A0ABW1JD57_9ACTN
MGRVSDDTAPAPPTSAELDAEGKRLLAFYTGAVDPRGGFGWMDDDGVPDPSQPLHLWINARMTHVYGLAHLLGVDGADALCDRGFAALDGLLRDTEHGGWWPQVDGSGESVLDEKHAYDHVFVLLAASTAVQAQRPGAQQLLADAIEVVERYFWDEEAGVVVDVWDGAWQTLDPYRGANANMHAVEAFTAAADATGDDVWLHRAARIADRLINGEARNHGWRLPEHFDTAWAPDLDYAKDNPGDQFRPYGATIGHSLEWARLLLQLDAALAAGPDGEPGWMVQAAQALFERAVADGWSVDGAPGLVYTVDWDGAPVVRERMHWVVAEGIGAAAALYQATGDPSYQQWFGRWWAYVQEFLISAAGSWQHELDAQNRPAATVWPGKPDAYHAVQATLVPRLPLAPAMAAALARGWRT